MAGYGSSALFVSAGGYHHHIGLNTWAGVGAPPPPPGSAGLRHFVVRLPDADALGAVVGRVRDAGLAVEEAPEGALIKDPSGNAVVLAVGDSSHRGEPMVK
jgi:catechol 2,3-dioxygenase